MSDEIKDEIFKFIVGLVILTIILLLIQELTNSKKENYKLQKQIEHNNLECYLQLSDYKLTLSEYEYHN